MGNCCQQGVEFMFEAPLPTHGWLAISHFQMLGLLFLFATIHSGLASLRSRVEVLMGARLYRILFALLSIPMAVLLIVFFIRHRYDGVQLWQLQNVPGIIPVIWFLSVVSFFFLYPATFNLLEIAAIQKPEVHLYETGIIRITRHPQMVGQIIWCVAHLLWLGTTFTLTTCLGLVGYHIFASWHGDRRLQKRYGEAFITVKNRTSIIPFAALLRGKQTLLLKEFLRPAYVGVSIFIGLLWWAHPFMVQAASKASL